MAAAADFLPIAVSVAAANPAAVGANWTLTVHDLRGPRLVPEHVSAVTGACDLGALGGVQLQDMRMGCLKT